MLGFIRDLEVANCKNILLDRTKSPMSHVSRDQVDFVPIVLRADH